MSKFFKLLAAVTVLGGVLLTPTVVGAGPTAPDPVIEVIKVVDGEAPEGTQFVVNVACDTPGPVSVDFTFPATGGTQSDSFSEDNACFVSETDDGGADTVTYDATCSGECSVESVGPDGVNLALRQPGAVATVTVTNTFAEAQPDDAAQEPADVVAATPSFTG